MIKCLRVGWNSVANSRLARDYCNVLWYIMTDISWRKWKTVFVKNLRIYSIKLQCLNIKQYASCTYDLIQDGSVRTIESVIFFITVRLTVNLLVVFFWIDSTHDIRFPGASWSRHASGSSLLVKLNVGMWQHLSVIIKCLGWLVYTSYPSR